MKIKYKLKQIYQDIFLIEFKNQFDLAMTFFRYQEYYESPNKKIFRNKNINLTSLIKLYSQDQDHKNFSYFNDWEGFNIPSFVLDDLLYELIDNYEPTIYDNEMFKIYLKIKALQKHSIKTVKQPFYLIRSCQKECCS